MVKDADTCLDHVTLLNKFCKKGFSLWYHMYGFGEEKIKMMLRSKENFGRFFFFYENV